MQGFRCAAKGKQKRTRATSDQTYGLTLEERGNCVPSKKTLHHPLNATKCVFYATSLPTSIDNVPGEKSLRKISKRFALKEFGNKVDLVKSLLDHGCRSATLFI